MEMITLEEFKTRAQTIIERLAAIDEIYADANALLEQLDYHELDEDSQYDAEEIAQEIAAAANWEFSDFDEGFWIPSTC